jgi:hypothetical protein
VFFSLYCPINTMTENTTATWCSQGNICMVFCNQVLLLCSFCFCFSFLHLSVDFKGWYLLRCFFLSLFSFRRLDRFCFTSSCKVALVSLQFIFDGLLLVSLVVSLLCQVKMILEKLYIFY